MRKKQLIILLHGYGSNGDDLKGLGEFWAGSLPGAGYASPDAPQLCEAGFGYQWFSLEGLAEQNRQQRLIAMRHDVDALLDRLFRQQQIDPLRDDIVLAGFSQGTMVALDILMRGRLPLKAVIGFSGRMVTPQPWQPKPGCEVLLVHGESDPVIPYQETLSAAELLNTAGVLCHWQTEPELEHTISGAGVEAATQFLVNRLCPEEDTG